jgi:hypothetical protein
MAKTVQLTSSLYFIFSSVAEMLCNKVRKWANSLPFDPNLTNRSAPPSSVQPTGIPAPRESTAWSAPTTEWA